MEFEFYTFDYDRDWAWCNQQVGMTHCEDTTGMVALTKTGEHVAACIMDNWTANSVQCHAMLTNPLVLRHKFLECMFEFMFNHMGVARVYGLVPESYAKAVKLNLHLGFTIKARLEEAFEVGVDYLLMEMKRENCRFIAQSGG